MKLKKFLLVLLATVSCLCLGVAFGCNDDKVEKFTVTFAASEHITYVLNGEEVTERSLEYEKNVQASFSVKVEDGFLPETVVVKANNETLAAANGVYSFPVTSNVTVTATVTEDLLEGEGTSQSPFKVSSLKDLRTVADMVNSSYTSYVTGYYELENDIDCGGAQLDVIGHFENQYAFFAGVFDGKGHTISNYKIETNGKSYAGLFGCVQISTSTTSVIIQNLNLKDFTIRATAAENANVSVGSIVAFSAGANVVACSAVNGEIYVYGSGYFSYAGGAVGVQQSLTINASNNLLYHYHATTEYVHTNVEVIAGNGYISAAGGVVGYSLTSHERAASIILNSYSEGTVYGAMRSGGVVGALGDYCSVANCYSTGSVHASVSFPVEVTDEDSFAYAGGVAGYAGAETAITDSFATGMVDATSVNTGKSTGEIVGGGTAATEFYQGVTLFNTPTGEAVKPTNADFIKNTLKWNVADWVIVDGAYPTINYDTSEISFNLTIDYLGKTVKGNAASQHEIEIKDESYFAFSSYLDDEIDEYIVADKAEGSSESFTSYGFFFDEECTIKVPYCYVPTRDITIFVGFKDYSEVAGNYEYTESTGRTVKLVLKADSTYQYVDVWTFDNLHYTYDGTKLIFKDGLFARLSKNVVVDEIAQPWLNYQPYTFVGSFEDNELSLYDGTYFTNELDDNGARDVLVFAAANEQVNKNGFVGTWERSATVKEKFTFNSDLTWSYSWKNDTKSGRYTLSNGVANMTGDIVANASIDASGLLMIQETGKEDSYYRLENSFFGNWYESDSNSYLVLNGYGSGLAGSASAIIGGTVYDNLAYVQDGFFDEVASSDYTYTILNGYSLFGYFTYNVRTRTVTAMLYEASNSEFLEFNFILLDYYLGEWIGEEEVGDNPFTIMDFNGLGLYKADGNAELGYVVINGKRVPYECNVENGLDGSFTYEGTKYYLSTNGNGTVTIKSEDGGDGANLYRKDDMANTPLLGSDGTIYEFNGGGNLSKGGVMSATTSKGSKTEYVYKIVEGSVSGLDIKIDLFEGSVDGTKKGTISIDKPKFVLSLNGQTDTLDLYLPFANKDWAIRGLVNSFHIGKFDLTYEATGTFNGTSNVPFVYYPEYNYIYVYYSYYPDEAVSATIVQIYLLILNDGNIAVSSYPYMVDGDYSYAAPCDEYFGSWTNTETKETLKFDGYADGMYTTGIAWNVDKNVTYLYTRRFGKVYMWLSDDEGVAYTVEMLYENASGNNIYRKEGGTLWDTMSVTETDVIGTPIFTATGVDETAYAFNFDGTVKVGDKSGTYLLSSVDGNSTTVVITVDGNTTTVVVNHADHTATVVD